MVVSATGVQAQLGEVEVELLAGESAPAARLGKRAEQRAAPAAPAAAALAVALAAALAAAAAGRRPDRHRRDRRAWRDLVH